MSDARGLKTVLQALAVRDGVVPALQDDLFGGDAAEGPVKKRDRGRPAGSRDVTTSEWARLLLTNYRPPLMVLGDIGNAPLEDLVDELQRIADKSAREERIERTDGTVVTVRSTIRIDPLAVLKLQAQCQEALAEYTNKKQPKAIEVERKQRGVVVLDMDADEAEIGDDDVEILGEQNQGVDDVARSQSDSAAVGRGQNLNGSRGLGDKAG